MIFNAPVGHSTSQASQLMQNVALYNALLLNLEEVAQNLYCRM